MLNFVPVRFDLYRTVRRHLHWTLQCLVGFADRTGKCWPSSRTLAAVGALGKSTIARHLAQLVRDGHVARERERVPGGGWRFVYRVATHFLPRAVSHQRKSGVPPAKTEEQSTKKKEALPDDLAQWALRLRAWRKSGGKFWPVNAGPRPDEPGCWAPAELLVAAQGGLRRDAVAAG